ncbi:Homer -like protein 1 [Echinococcus granulosus]|uniref:EVH1 n=1 Tax=Echinococcus granulosus TaxID=6210 RepID=A0A068WIF1_ECHGR|nr:Homer -like protein 1 [Echinococcus granulosus]CDS17386.1 EVH1 [Echinococcus granulosus]
MGPALQIVVEMGEQPIFTCQAHVFTINPSTRRSWVQASSKAIDINIFFDSSKQCYRIVSVEDGPTGMKVVINSTITPKMVFKQTSQKFGQWADPKSSGVFGLGFDSEVDLSKFVAQFRQCVENTKQTNGESVGQAATKKGESHSSPLRNGHPVLPEALAVGERSTLPLAASPNPTLLNTFHSGIGSLPGVSTAMTTVGESASVGGDSQQLIHQQYYQERIQRLERELEAVRRQASKHIDSVSPSSPVKTISDGVDLRDGLERVHLVSSDGGSGASGTITGARGGASLAHKAPILLAGVGGGGDTVEQQLVGSEGGNPPDSAVALLKLHNRLGRILQEACDLHKQIGHLLATVANQSV